MRKLSDLCKSFATVCIRPWGHVAGIDNPADIGSRGVTESFLSASKLWWEGPEWLKGGESEWPTSLVLQDSAEVESERKKVSVFSVLEGEGAGKVGKVIELVRYSSLERLLRVTAWIKRFISNLKRAKEKREIRLGELEVAEVEEAERDWILDAQEDLKSDEGFEKTRINLGLVKEDEIYICRGRLANSNRELQSKSRHHLAQKSQIYTSCYFGLPQKGTSFEGGWSAG